MAEVTVFYGLYGSGKSEISINYALRLASEGRAVTIVDLDAVTPYFRVRDAREHLLAQGVNVVAPKESVRHADLPVLPEGVRRVLLQGDRDVVVDVGGDPTGARVLGGLKDALRPGARGWFVVNALRPFSRTLDEAADAVLRVTTSAGLAPQVSSQTRTLRKRPLRITSPWALSSPGPGPEAGFCRINRSPRMAGSARVCGHPFSVLRDTCLSLGRANKSTRMGGRPMDKRVTVNEDHCKSTNCLNVCPKKIISCAQLNRQGYHPAFIRRRPGAVFPALCARMCPTRLRPKPKGGGGGYGGIIALKVTRRWGSRDSCRMQVYFGIPYASEQISEYMARRLKDEGGVFVRPASRLSAWSTALQGGRGFSSPHRVRNKPYAGSHLLHRGGAPCVIVNMSRGGPGLGGSAVARTISSRPRAAVTRLPAYRIAPRAIQEGCDLMAHADVCGPVP